MSTHETFVQYLKIGIATVSVLFFLVIAIRISNQLDSIIRLQQLNNEIFNLNLTK